MKILKRGFSPLRRPTIKRVGKYIGCVKRCQSCACMFQIEKKDLKKIKEYYDYHTFAVIECPFCGTEAVLGYEV